MSETQPIPTPFPPAAAPSRAFVTKAKTTGLGNVLERSFYFWMSLLIAAVVVYGFSFTVNPNLFHPPSPRPAILYVHAVLFTGWLAFLTLQSALVRTRNVKVHRTLGWFGLALGATMPLVGVATAIVMTRMHIRAGTPQGA